MNVHVLIIDDEPLIRESVTGALADEGFETSAAASGAEGWRRFQADRPDVVVLDLRLGDLDGLDLLKRIREEDADVPGPDDQRRGRGREGLDQNIDRPAAAHAERGPEPKRLDARIRRRP